MKPLVETCVERHLGEEEAAAVLHAQGPGSPALVPNDGGGAANPPRARGLARSVQALRQRDFRRFWFGALVASSGIWMQNVTVPLLLYQRTGQATWAGLGAFCQFGPAMLASPIGGVAADRFSLRRLVIGTQSIALGVALALAALSAADATSPGVLLVLVAFTGTANGLQTPSWQGLIPHLVPRHQVLNAVALNAAQANIARALGPVLAGILLARQGPTAAFLANAGANTLMLVALATIRPARVHRTVVPGAVLRRVLAGVVYTRRHTGLLVAVGTAGLVSFVGTPVIQLAPVLTREVFDVGDVGYGLLVSSLGLGVVTGMVLVSILGEQLCRSSIIRLAVAVHAGGLIGLAIAPAFSVALAATFVLGIAYLAALSTANASVQVLVSEEYRGRVVSLYWMAFAGAYPVGALMQGWVADLAGSRTALAVGGALLLAALAVLAHRSALDALDEHHHAPAPLSRHRSARAGMT